MAAGSNRGIRTERYTYVRDRSGPWLLFDNAADPEQRRNLVSAPEHSALQSRLETMLARKLKDSRDEFLPGEAYIKQWGYIVNPTAQCLTHREKLIDRSAIHVISSPRCGVILCASGAS